MKKSNCSVRFYLYEKVKNPNGFPIYCRIIVDRKKSEFATDQFCTPEKWDKASGLPIRTPRIKEYLTHIESEIFTLKRNLEFNKKEVSAKILKSLYKNSSSSSVPNLNEHFESFISRISDPSLGYSKGRMSQYGTTKKYLFEFLQSHKLGKMKLSEFDIKLIQEFDLYLGNTIQNQNTGKPISRNSINNHHKRLKTILIDAYRKEYINRNPYENFKIRNEKTNREYLSELELSQIRDFDFENQPKLDRVRDIFIFSCYTGLRFSDAQSLNQKNISKDENGTYWIAFKQAKTNLNVKIPILEPALDIYNKYAHIREVNGKVLPKISNQRFNSYIKDVINKIGIDKSISHHIARHTFATTVTLSNNVPITVVSNLLGHTSLKTTQIYAKITDKSKAEFAEMLNSKIK